MAATCTSSYSRSTRADRAVTVAADRLASLRGELARHGVQGFLVPRADEHQGEYVPASAERLAWLTGFTGSAGLAVVLPETAAIFVDGRYTLQAQERSRRTALPTAPHNRYAGDRVDRQESASPVRSSATIRVSTPCPSSNAMRLRPRRPAASCNRSTDNPLDAVWRDRPAAPMAPVCRMNCVSPAAPARTSVVRSQRHSPKTRSTPWC